MRSGEVSGGVLPVEMPDESLDTICRPEIYGHSTRPGAAVRAPALGRKARSKGALFDRPAAPRPSTAPDRAASRCRACRQGPGDGGPAQVGRDAGRDKPVCRPGRCGCRDPGTWGRPAARGTQNIEAVLQAATNGPERFVELCRSGRLVLRIGHATHLDPAT